MAVEENNLQNEIPGRGDQKEAENSSVSVEGSAVETVIAIEAENRVCHVEKNGDLGLVSSELGSTKAVAEASDQVEQQSDEDSSNSSVEVLAETRIVINPSEAPIVGIEDNSVLNAKIGEVGLSKVSMGESKSKICGPERHSRVIDINCGSAKGCADKWDGESVCRICHLSSDQSPDRRATGTSVSDLIQLGCGCKDDLGITHYQCAEAWFKLKGNRYYSIFVLKWHSSVCAKHS